MRIMLVWLILRAAAAAAATAGLNSLDLLELPRPREKGSSATYSCLALLAHGRAPRACTRPETEGGMGACRLEEAGVLVSQSVGREKTVE